MRTLTFGGAISLDGFLAGPDQAIDWLQWGDEAAAVMADYWATVDTVLMGRKTYAVAAASGPQGEMPGITGYVFSRTLPDTPGVNIVREDAAGFVRRLKGEPGKGICLMGGGDLARSLFEAGLIDEIGFNVHPLLLGGGTPTFLPMGRRVELELKECRAFRNGCAYLMYRVKN